MGGKPLFAQLDSTLERQTARDAQDGIVGGIVGKEELLHLVERSLGYVRDLTADDRPPIGVHPIGHGSEQQVRVAIGLIQIPLLELLDDHLFLHGQRLGRKGEAEHAVGLQPEGGLYIVCGSNRVVIGHIVAGPGIVLTPGLLQRSIEIGDMHRPTEHEVLEQMGKSGARG